MSSFRSNSNNFDARARIEQRKRAKQVQAKVDAVRRSQKEQKPRFSNGRFPPSRNNNPLDLSSKLVNSRRKFSTVKQPVLRQKTLQNFTVVASVEPNTAPTVSAISRRLSASGRVGNLTRTIVNDKASPAVSVRTSAPKRRSDSNAAISLLKRRRQISTNEMDDSDLMMVDGTGTRERPFGAAGMFFSAVKDAQSPVDGYRSVALRTSNVTRLTGTMVADTVDSHSKSTVRENLQRRLQRRTSLSDDSVDTSPASFKVTKGYRVLITNLTDIVSSDDIKELFGVVGELHDAYVIEPGIAEAVFLHKEDAEAAVKDFHNRQLDGIPMRCNLLPTVTVADKERKGKTSSVTLNGRFQGADKPGSFPATTVKAEKGPVPERDLVTSVLFRSRAASKDDTTFTVKV